MVEEVEILIDGKLTKNWRIVKNGLTIWSTFEKDRAKAQIEKYGLKDKEYIKGK